MPRASSPDGPAPATPCQVLKHPASPPTGKIRQLQYQLIPGEATWQLKVNKGALEKTKHQVPEAVFDVCGVFLARCSEEARDIRTSLAADEHTIGKLVFTAYAQLKSQAMQTRALNAIDRMDLEGLSSANTHLAEFER